jgi:hypothetical protein
MERQEKLMVASSKPYIKVPEDIKQIESKLHELEDRCVYSCDPQLYLQANTLSMHPIYMFLCVLDELSL